ncbi:hypothetical protein PORY_002045 [Pneumocystis oryctolagi]|uniref:Uncharacterized protein n=1 Tax=Pneumocystis oryctolagi TaxID=42067 RepID=A0ACB7CA94_9ASCO|nr:hypothetical protein PORY_002045 [Pneumocystis oryctolagi]
MTIRITSKMLEQALKERLDAVEAIIQDVSGGCGNAFRCQVVSEKFANMNILARHRLVNAALKEEINNLHSFSQEDYTPEEWSKLQQNDSSKS